MTEYRSINQPVIKKDAMQLVTGQPVYTDDIIPQDCLIIKILRSPHAHALIEDIDVSRAKLVPGIEDIWTWKDVPQLRFTEAGQTYPETSCYDRLILDRRVRFVGDAVAIVAGETEAAVNRALKMIKVKYEVLEPILDFRKALDNPILVHPEEDWHHNGAFLGADNKRNLIGVERSGEGDLEGVLADCDYVLDETYTTGAVQQTMMETFRTYAAKDYYGRLKIISSTQIPFHVRRIIANALGIPKSRIRVIKPRIGGGFGAKQTAVSEVYPAFVTWMTGKPSKIIYSRRECQIAGSPRHQMQVRVRVGAMKNGLIRAVDMQCLSNGGAYSEHGWATAGLVGHKGLSVYGRMEAYRFNFDVVYTNTQACGAYRGFGATQGCNAIENTVNKLAAKIGMDPAEIRFLNMTREGMDMLTYGHIINQSCALDQCLETVKQRLNWDNRPLRQDMGNGKVRGLGVAMCMQGSGIAGIDIGTITIKMEDDGLYFLSTGATDMGTGSDTALSQMAAEVLGCDVDEVVPFGVDTDVSPYDCGSYASSSTYVTGLAAVKAAEKLVEKIKEAGARILKVDVSEVDFDGDSVYRVDGQGQISRKELAKHNMNGSCIELVATAANSQPTSPPPYVVGGCEVEVDMETGEVEVLEFDACVDCGTVINTNLARVQTEGGLLQGIGMTLTENVLVSDKGRTMSNSFMQYKIPSRLDTPRHWEIDFRSSYEPSGPFGAKSIGEVVINTPAPAIAQAIYHATGLWFNELPITPEKIRMGLKNQNK